MTTKSQMASPHHTTCTCTEAYRLQHESAIGPDLGANLDESLAPTWAPTLAPAYDNPQTRLSIAESQSLEGA